MSTTNPNRLRAWRHAWSMPRYVSRHARWQWRMILLMFILPGGAFAGIWIAGRLGSPIANPFKPFIIVWGTTIALQLVTSVWVVVSSVRLRKSLNRSPEPPCPECGYSPGPLPTCPECALVMTVEQRRDCWRQAGFNIPNQSPER